jgi:hypothetical protein
MVRKHFKSHHRPRCHFVQRGTTICFVLLLVGADTLIRILHCPVFKYIKLLILQFRNQYDNDVTTWSPQGRLHQVEYAMEAVKQGSATIGVKSKTHAVLVALKRASSELSAYQKKIMSLDDHMGMSIAGLTADAKSLSRWMRTECLSSRYYYSSALRLETLMNDLGIKMQACIQGYNKRPYGVGLLVAGYDDLGPHIYQVHIDFVNKSALATADFVNKSTLA